MNFELRASASSRWMSCTASATIDVTHLAPRKADYGASFGTALHELSRMALVDGVNPRKYIGSLVEDVEITRAGVEDIVLPYVAFVKKHAECGRLLVEKTVEYNDHIGGTPDVGILLPEIIHVIDLKTGGMRVEVVGNSQLMIYLLSLYRKYCHIYDFKKFAITIFQPMANNITTHWISMNDLLKFQAELLRIYDNIMNLDVSFVPSGHNCFYCPAKAVCPALMQKATEMAQLDFMPKNLDGKELAEKLALIDIILPFIAAVQEEAMHRLRNNIRVPGYKLHPGNNKREWKDERAAVMALRKAGVDGYFTDPVIRSPHQIEELIKQQKVNIDLGDLICTTSGEPRLSKEKVKVEADMTENAVHDFEELRNAPRKTGRSR